MNIKLQLFHKLKTLGQGFPNGGGAKIRKGAKRGEGILKLTLDILDLQMKSKKEVLGVLRGKLSF